MCRSAAWSFLVWGIVSSIIEETFGMLHLQFFTVHLQVLSNRIHDRQNASKRTPFLMRQCRQ